MGNRVRYLHFRGWGQNGGLLGVDTRMTDIAGHHSCWCAPDERGWHIPHGRMEDPVIQYLGVNKGDGKHGRPIIDAPDGVPIYGQVIVHNGWKPS